MEADVIPGMVAHVPKGGIETAVNVGAEPYYEVIVELKERAEQGDDSEATARRRQRSDRRGAERGVDP
jgi:hypothetical protein